MPSAHERNSPPKSQRYGFVSPFRRRVENLVLTERVAGAQPRSSVFMASTPRGAGSSVAGAQSQRRNIGCRSTLSVLSFRRFEQPFALARNMFIPVLQSFSQATQAVAQYLAGGGSGPYCPHNLAVLQVNGVEWDDLGDPTRLIKFLGRSLGLARGLYSSSRRCFSEQS